MTITTTRSPRLSDYGDIMTVAELQELCRIGRDGAYALVNSGAVGAIRNGRTIRIPRQSVERYLAKADSEAQR